MAGCIAVHRTSRHDVLPSMTTPDDAHTHESTPSNGTIARGDATKPLTIMVAEDILRKLKIVAIMKETSVSELLAEAATAVVKRDLKKVLGKLDL